MPSSDVRARPSARFEAATVLSLGTAVPPFYARSLPGWLIRFVAGVARRGSADRRRCLTPVPWVGRLRAAAGFVVATSVRSGWLTPPSHALGGARRMGGTSVAGCGVRSGAAGRRLPACGRCSTDGRDVGRWSRQVGPVRLVAVSRLVGGARRMGGTPVAGRGRSVRRDWSPSPGHWPALPDGRDNGVGRGGRSVAAGRRPLGLRVRGRAEWRTAEAAVSRASSRSCVSGVTAAGHRRGHARPWRCSAQPA
jgi:hypothetical protein